MSIILGNFRIVLLILVLYILWFYRKVFKWGLVFRDYWEFSEFDKFLVFIRLNMDYFVIGVCDILRDGYYV